ncbi:hypothetical protein FRC11_010520 [Ceratobasidium sp. 423]|nr:hypothetical protein FRC11_010520 [Ceratobasidium sp. 423]
MAFLCMLRVVARYLMAACAAILESRQYHAVAVMLDLVQSHVALELKGKLFDTLAAFCEGPELGGEVAQLMWARGGWKKSQGVPAELEEIKAPVRMYPATLSFLHLLNTLVPFPPDKLGSGHHMVGTGPYIKFVLDSVLLKVDTWEYVDAGERWKVMDTALKFIQASLEGFDLSTLRVKKLGAKSIQKLVQHPRFNVLLHILVDSGIKDMWLREVVLLSVRLIMNLSMLLCFNLMETSSAFPHQVSRLSGILGDVAVNRARIVNGYIQGLKLKPGEELGEEDNQIWDAIINFLLVNMTTTVPSPNFAHLLLGFDILLLTSGAMPTQDSCAIGACENCLGVMLDMVGEGIPHLD